MDNASIIAEGSYLTNECVQCASLIVKLVKEADWNAPECRTSRKESYNIGAEARKNDDIESRLSPSIWGGDHLPLSINAAVGHDIHRYVQCMEEHLRTFSLHDSLDELYGDQITIAIQWHFSKDQGSRDHAAGQEVSIGGSLSDTGRAAVCALLQRNSFLCMGTQHMTGVPRSITEHRLKIRQVVFPHPITDDGRSTNLVLRSKKSDMVAGGCAWTSPTSTKHERVGIKPLSRQKQKLSSNSLTAHDEESPVVKWEVSRFEQIPIQVSRQVTPLVQNTQEVCEEGRLPLNTGAEELSRSLMQQYSRHSLASRTSVYPGEELSMLPICGDAWAQLALCTTTDRGSVTIHRILRYFQAPSSGIHRSNPIKQVKGQILAGFYLRKYQIPILSSTPPRAKSKLPETMEYYSRMDRHAWTWEMASGSIDVQEPKWDDTLVGVVHLNSGTLPQELKDARRRFCRSDALLHYGPRLWWLRALLRLWVLLAYHAPRRAATDHRNVRSAMYIRPSAPTTQELTHITHHGHSNVGITSPIWIEAGKRVATITGKQVNKRFVWIKIVLPFVELTGEDSVGQGKTQFCDIPFQDCVLAIKHYASGFFIVVGFKHPQTKWLVDCGANRSLGEGNKASWIDTRRWVEEVITCLVGHNSHNNQSSAQGTPLLSCILGRNRFYPERIGCHTIRKRRERFNITTNEDERHGYFVYRANDASPTRKETGKRWGTESGKDLRGYGKMHLEKEIAVLHVQLREHGFGRELPARGIAAIIKKCYL
ncbi:hypothetical protein Tco_1545922 [Tanacetum coccineum]